MKKHTELPRTGYMHVHTYIRTCIHAYIHVPGYVGIHKACDVLQKGAQPHIEVRGLLALLNAAVEELVEVLERVLVHGVHLTQRGHHEVHD